MKTLNRKIKITLVMVTILASMLAISEAASKITVIAGRERVETSLISSIMDKDDSRRTVVFANADNFADALSATNLVNKYNARLILVSKKTKSINDHLDKINPERIFFVGGVNTLYGESIDNIEAKYSNERIDGESKVKRIWGKDRYETNAKTLEYTGYKDVGVASGEKFPDALAASGLLFEKNLGLKLVKHGPYDVGDLNVVYTFGGRNSVSQDGGMRLEGTDRYRTSEAIMSEIKDPNIGIIARGDNFADALSSLNLLRYNNGVGVVFISNAKLSKEQLEYTKRMSEIIVVGQRISEETLNDISNYNNLDKYLIKKYTGDIEGKFNKKPVVQRSVENKLETINHPSKVLKLSMNKAYSNKLRFKVEDGDIKVFSKNGGKEFVLCAISIDDEGEDFRGAKRIGTITKNGQKKVVMIFYTNYREVDAELKGIAFKNFVKNGRLLDSVLNSGIEGINGYKFTKEKNVSYYTDWYNID